MKTKAVILYSALAAAGMAASATTTGCELIASVDRSQIPDDAGISVGGAGGGTGGTAGAGGTAGSGGMGGKNTGGMGGTGGIASGGGGTGGVAGMGGAGGTGGNGGAGGCVPATCGATHCGMKPDNCGNMLNCNDGIKNDTETDVDCGGPSCPTCAQGKTCSVPGDCTAPSAFCADSVCCDSGCLGTCKACTAAKKGSGADGTCDFIAAGTDPDSECTAPATCDGAGMCM